MVDEKDKISNVFPLAVVYRSDDEVVSALFMSDTMKRSLLSLAPWFVYILLSLDQVCLECFVSIDLFIFVIISFLGKFCTLLLSMTLLDERDGSILQLTTTPCTNKSLLLLKITFLLTSRRKSIKHQQQKC